MTTTLRQKSRNCDQEKSTRIMGIEPELQRSFEFFHKTSLKKCVQSLLTFCALADANFKFENYCNLIKTKYWLENMNVINVVKSMEGGGSRHDL